MTIGKKWKKYHLMDKENVFSKYNGGGRGAALLQPYFYSTKMD